MLNVINTYFATEILVIFMEAKIDFAQYQSFMTGGTLIACCLGVVTENIFAGKKEGHGQHRTSGTGSALRAL